MAKFFSRGEHTRRAEHAEGEDTGFFARLFLKKLAIIGGFFLLCLVAIYILLDTNPYIPVFDIPGSAVELLKQIVIGLSVVLIAYIFTYLIYRKDEALLNSGEVERISGRVADRVIKATRTPPLDDILFHHSSNAAALFGEHNEIWIARETGSSLFSECADQIDTLLESGCRFKILLTNPDGPGAIHTDFRNAGNTKHPLRLRFEHASQTLSRILDKSPQYRERLELRLTPYALPATLIITNPKPRSGVTKISYRTIGNLAEEAQQRLSLESDSASSPNLARFMRTEFERMFRASSKVVLLMDNPDFSDWSQLFPTFHGLRNGKGIKSEKLFLVLFDVGNDGAKDIHVSYGYAASRAIKRVYAKSSGPRSFTVSRDSFVELSMAIDQAVLSGAILFFGNLGPVAIGDRAQCDKLELTAQDVELTTPEHQAYVSTKLRSGAGTASLRLSDTILDIMNNVPSAHLYLHFKGSNGRGQARRAKDDTEALMQRILEHERSSVIIAPGARAQLHDELGGSIRANSLLGSTRDNNA